MERLTIAYSHGIFPWFTKDEPILWWSPDPRLVLKPEAFKLRRSLVKSIRKQGFEIRINKAFSKLIELCARTRHDKGTWITDAMQNAYIAMHQAGRAISVETYRENSLVGGLYGVKIGHVFFGESMVSLVPDASKAALAYLCGSDNPCQIALIDCQVPTSHLESLGANMMPREKFLDALIKYCHE